MDVNDIAYDALSRALQRHGGLVTHSDAYKFISENKRVVRTVYKGMGVPVGDIPNRVKELEARVKSKRDQFKGKIDTRPMWYGKGKRTVKGPFRKLG